MSPLWIEEAPVKGGAKLATCAAVGDDAGADRAALTLYRRQGFCSSRYSAGGQHLSLCETGHAIARERACRSLSRPASAQDIDIRPVSPSGSSSGAVMINDPTTFRVLIRCPSPDGANPATAPAASLHHARHVAGEDDPAEPR